MGEMGLARPYDIIFGTDFGVSAIFNKSHNPFWQKTPNDESHNPFRQKILNVRNELSYLF